MRVTMTWLIVSRKALEYQRGQIHIASWYGITLVDDTDEPEEHILCILAMPTGATFGKETKTLVLFESIFLKAKNSSGEYEARSGTGNLLNIYH